MGIYKHILICKFYFLSRFTYMNDCVRIWLFKIDLWFEYSRPCGMFAACYILTTFRGHGMDRLAWHARDSRALFWFITRSSTFSGVTFQCRGLLSIHFRIKLIHLFFTSTLKESNTCYLGDGRNVRLKPAWDITTGERSIFGRSVGISDSFANFWWKICSIYNARHDDLKYVLSWRRKLFVNCKPFT